MILLVPSAVKGDKHVSESSITFKLVFSQLESSDSIFNSRGTGLSP